MKHYKFDKGIDRKNTYCVKWDSMPAEAPEGTLPMWIADMDVPCAEPITEAICDFAKSGASGYSTIHAGDYMDVVVKWLSEKHDIVVKKEEVLYSPGIVPAISTLIQLLTEPGDSVLIQPPVYPPFSAKINGNERKVANNPLINTDNYYTVDFEDFEKQISKPEVKGFLLCNPHNPVGRAWSKEELRKMVDLCKKYDKWIISDEIHADILRTGLKHVATEVAAPDYKHKIYTCYAPSKTFNIAGLQNSHIIIRDEELRERWEQFMAVKGGAVATPYAIVATRAAYTDETEWLPQMKAYMDENVEVIDKFLKENLPKAKYHKPEATFLAWIDLSEYISDAKELDNALLQKGKVFLNPGYTFGEEGTGFVRLNFGCSKDMLLDALERIKTAVL